MSTDQVFCSDCGAANESDAVYCESCGHPLAETETPVEAAPAASSAPPPVQSPAPARRVSPKLIAIVVLLVAAAAGAMVYRAPLMALLGSKQTETVAAAASDSVQFVPSSSEPQLNDRGTGAAAPKIAVVTVPGDLQVRVPPSSKPTVTKPQPAPKRPPEQSDASAAAPNLPGSVAAFPEDFKPPTSEPAPTPAIESSSKSDAAVTTSPAREPAPVPAAGRIAAGSVISLKSSDNVCTDKTREGAHFAAVVQQDIQGSNGGTIPKGSVVTFVVDRLKRGAANKKPEFSVAAESIELGGKRYPVDASIDAVSVKAKKASLMGALVGAATVIAVTKAAGGDAKQTVAGAAAGGAAGAVIGSQLKTGDGCIEKNASIRITLKNDITIGGM